jgi:hypothetical protein
MNYLALAEAIEARHRPTPAAESSCDPALEVSRLLALPLDGFEREGRPLEIRVPWYPVTLWFVPRGREVEMLARDGIARGRIWTAQELVDLLNIAGLTGAQLRTVAVTKLEFAGDLIGTRPRRPTQEDA